jgi:hypothetical protein
VPPELQTITDGALLPASVMSPLYATSRPQAKRIGQKPAGTLLTALRRQHGSETAKTPSGTAACAKNGSAEAAPRRRPSAFDHARAIKNHNFNRGLTKNRPNRARAMLRYFLMDLRKGGDPAQFLG